MPGVQAVIPGARTVLLEYDPTQTSFDALAEAVSELDVQPEPATGGAEVAIAVRYDGPDLAAVADEIGCSVADLIRRHSGARYRVAFCGFAPGFAYLSGLDPLLHVPRLAEPRTTVPAGSVAIAGEFTAVYPRRSPGGWRLLGTSSTRLWQLDRDPPALLTPGTAVRFVAT
jgi:KipI family sensor histidine kinase inhibitor